MARHLEKLTLGWIIAFSLAVQAEEPKCDCRWPFQPEPPCFDFCSGKKLPSVPPEDLATILDISNELAGRIAMFATSGSFSTLQDLRAILSPAEYDLVESRIRNLSEAQAMRLFRLSD